jgi:hypothetical protein
MIVISVFVTAVIFFLAGMHWATWDQNRDQTDANNSLWWSMVLVLIGLYNMVNLVSFASRV